MMLTIAMTAMQKTRILIDLDLSIAWMRLGLPLEGRGGAEKGWMEWDGVGWRPRDFGTPPIRLILVATPPLRSQRHILLNPINSVTSPQHQQLISPPGYSPPRISPPSRPRASPPSRPQAMVKLVTNLPGHASSAKEVTLSTLPVSVPEGTTTNVPASIFFKPTKMRKVGEKNAFYSQVTEIIDDDESSAAEVTPAKEENPAPTPPNLDAVDDTTETDYMVATLRGRQLVGRKIAVPSGMKGVILAKDTSSGGISNNASMFGEVEESLSEEVKYDGHIKCVGVFDNFVQ